MKGKVGVADTLGAARIKGGLSQPGMFWDAGGEWSRQNRGVGVRPGASLTRARLIERGQPWTKLLWLYL